MSNKVMRRKYRSWRKTLFQLSVVVLIAMWWAYGFLYSAQLTTQPTINQKQAELQKLQQQIQELWGEEQYTRLELARKIVQDINTLPRSKHIPLLIDMLQELQDTNYVGSNRIQLTDFSISLDEIRLKGKVSNLVLLYQSLESRWYTSLIERFQQLEFIEQLAINKYKAFGDGIEFVLSADVIQLND